MTTSLRKRYPTRVESPDRDEPPIASIPAAAAESPPPVADKQPAEQPEAQPNLVEQPPVESDPVREAEQNAIKARLREMETAEHLQHEAASQRQQRLAAEPPPAPNVEHAEGIIAASGFPERAKNWLRQHPDLVTNPVENARLAKLHHVAEYQSGEAFSNAYFNRLDVLFGFKQESRNGAQQPSAPPAPRNSAPAQHSSPPRRMAAPVSAPPTREVPSMTTG